eukprot:13291825-Alexandrium_andersonii.AAC.1
MPSSCASSQPPGRPCLRWELRVRPAMASSAAVDPPGESCASSRVARVLSGGAKRPVTGAAGSSGGGGRSGPRGCASRARSKTG